MKTTLVLCALMSAVYTKPAGVFHEEYQYKSSSQSYKNNELQHQNENEGFFSKDGDLEGRLKPKVQSHEQHSEYVNPRLQYGYNQANNVDSQYGNHLGSSSLSSLSSIYDKPSLVSSGYGTGGSYSTSAGYATAGQYNSGGYHGSGSTTSSNMLSQLSQRVQQDISRQLQEAIRNQYRQSSAYTINRATMESDIRLLEQELKRNLTTQLQEALSTQYGSQTAQGGYTYSMGGSTNPTSSYTAREFDELKRQLENDLVRQLNDQVRSVYTTSSQISSTYQSTGGTFTHVPQPRLVPLNVVTYYPTSNTNSLSSLTTQNTYRQYTPIPNPDSITVIATKIQSNLNNYLNTLLHETQKNYLSDTNSYLTVSNLDSYIETLKYQLQQNLTTFFDEEIRRNYGSVVIRNDYTYSVASDGTQSPNHNYRVSDLENLKRQVEQHLLSKIERDFQSIRQEIIQRSYSTINTSTYRPIIYRPNSNGQLMTTNIYGHSTSGTNTGSQINSYEWNNLQRQLQSDLSQQVQEALRQQQYRQSNAYTASSTFNPNENYNIVLQQLTDELKRNLTQRLEQSIQGRYSGSSSSSGGSYAYGMSSGGSYSPNSDQLASLQSQLQNDLMQQLRQGLQQSYSKYSSFSASASSSNYGYGSGSQVMGDDPYDCMNDDPNHLAHRLKRSLDDPKVSSFEYSYHSPVSGGLHHTFGSQELMSRHYQSSHGISRSHNGISNTDVFPEISGYSGRQPFGTDGSYKVSGFHDGNLNIGNPRMLSHSDGLSGGQTLGTGSRSYSYSYASSGTGSKPVSYSYSRHTTYHGQPSRQHTYYQTFNTHQGSTSGEINRGSSTFDDDLKQEIEGSEFENFGIPGSHTHGSSGISKIFDHEDRNVGKSKTEISGVSSDINESSTFNSDVTNESHFHSQSTQESQNKQALEGQTEIELGQMEDNSELTQQAVDESTQSYLARNKLHHQSSSGQTEIEFGQEIDDAELTQQTENNDFGSTNIIDQKLKNQEDDDFHILETKPYQQTNKFVTLGINSNFDQVPNEFYHSFDNQKPVQKIVTFNSGKYNTSNLKQEASQKDKLFSTEAPNHILQILSTETGSGRFQNGARGNQGRQYSQQEQLVHTYNQQSENFNKPGHHQAISDSLSQPTVSDLGSQSKPSGIHNYDEEHPEQHAYHTNREFQNHGQNHIDIQIPKHETIHVYTQHQITQTEEPKQTTEYPSLLKHSQQRDDLTQDEILTQQVEQPNKPKLTPLGLSYGQSSSRGRVNINGQQELEDQNLAQQTIDDGLTQQTENDSFEMLTHGNTYIQPTSIIHGQKILDDPTQQAIDHYSTQQTEDDSFHKFTHGNIYSQTSSSIQGQKLADDGLTQQTIDNGSRQQTEGNGFEKFSQSNTYSQTNGNGLGQKLIDDGLTQQTIDDGLTQQVEDNSFEKFSQSNIYSQTSSNDREQKSVDHGLTQQTINNGLTQQTEDDSFEKFSQSNGQTSNNNYGQKLLNDDLTQQTVDDGLTQQTEDNSFEKFSQSNIYSQTNSNGHGQKLVDDGLTQQTIDDFTQQVEDKSFEKFVQSNSHQQTSTSSQVHLLNGQQNVDNSLEKTVSTGSVFNNQNTVQKDALSRQQILDDDLTQQTVDDLTHQVEDNSFEKFTQNHNSQNSIYVYGQEQVGDQKIKQEAINDNSFGNFETGYDNQKPNNYHLSQQIEDATFDSPYLYKPYNKNNRQNTALQFSINSQSNKQTSQDAISLVTTIKPNHNGANLNDEVGINKIQKQEYETHIYSGSDSNKQRNNTLLVQKSIMDFINHEVDDSKSISANSNPNSGRNYDINQSGIQTDTSAFRTNQKNINLQFQTVEGERQINSHHPRVYTDSSRILNNQYVDNTRHNGNSGSGSEEITLGQKLVHDDFLRLAGLQGENDQKIYDDNRDSIIVTNSGQHGQGLDAYGHHNTRIMSDSYGLRDHTYYPASDISVNHNTGAISSDGIHSSYGYSSGGYTSGTSRSMSHSRTSGYGTRGNPDHISGYRGHGSHSDSNLDVINADNFRQLQPQTSSDRSVYPFNGNSNSFNGNSRLSPPGSYRYESINSKPHSVSGSNSYYSSSHHSNSGSGIKGGLKVDNNVETETVAIPMTTTTTEAGFWSRVGNSISSGTTNVRDKLGI